MSHGLTCVLLRQAVTKQDVACKAKLLNTARKAALAQLKAHPGSDLLSSLLALKATFLEQCKASAPLRALGAIQH